jgi:hypothetical protein
MVRVRSPKLDERPVPVIADDDLSALLRTRAGGTFEPARHPFDTHAPQHRRAPRGDGRLTLENVDLKARELFVTGKGRRARALPLGPKAMKNLDRYLRARAHHKDAALPWLWLGPEGRLTESGIAQMIKRCSREAGLEPSVHPHQFRHTCSHQWLAAAERNTRPREGQRLVEPADGWSLMQLPQQPNELEWPIRESQRETS